MPPLSPAALKVLSDIVTSFSSAEAEKVKAIESRTNHDVKAVEYFLKDAFAASGSAELRAVQVSCGAQTGATSAMADALYAPSV